MSGSVLEIAHGMSSSTDNRFLCFVLIRTSVEKPDSHKYVEGKGSRITKYSVRVEFGPAGPNISDIFGPAGLFLYPD